MLPLLAIFGLCRPGAQARRLVEPTPDPALDYRMCSGVKSTALLV